MDHKVSPLSVQSSKLIDWLLSRKLLQNDYPKRLNAVKDQWAKLSGSLQTEATASPAGVTYIHALDTVTVLHKQDSTTDFFGRANPVLRSWRDLVHSYEQRNLHLAELSEAIQDIASACVPRCKTIIAYRQKQITDLRQKIKEHASNVSAKEDLLSKAHRELHIDVPDERIKLHLLEAAANLPSHFDSYINSLKCLQKAVEFYQSMCTHMFKRDGDTPAIPFNVCPTLTLLLNTGHISLYEYEHGKQPDQVKTDDDFINDLLIQERLNVEAATVTSLSPEPADLEISGGIQWDDADPTEAEFEIIDAPNGSTFDLEVEEDGNVVEVKIEGTVASGKSARLLLDTIEGRTALINDLTELGAFLTRFLEGYVELHSLEGDEQAIGDPSIINAAKSFTGSTTISSNILQNAPASIRNASFCELAQWLNDVEQARSWFFDSARNQLLLIRSKPGHLDRLMSRLSDLRTQVERAKGRIAEAQLRIQEAELEQDHQTATLSQYRLDCKALVSVLEKELSRICNRPVQITGQVLDL